METTYVGNVGRHLLRAPNINYPSLTAVAANPSYSTNYFNQYQGFSGITQNRSDSNTNYNALQVYLTKRKGQINYTVSYTYAKALGDSSSNGGDLAIWTSLSYNYGELGIDRRHAFVGTVVWQLPEFRNHLILHETIGGFQIVTVARVQSGPYQTISGNTATGGRRADYVGGPMYLVGSRFALPSHQAQWLNPAAFAPAPGVRFGNSGVGTAILPGLEQGDVTVSKSFSVGDRFQLKIQGDAFNVLNKTNYSGLTPTYPTARLAG